MRFTTRLAASSAAALALISASAGLGQASNAQISQIVDEGLSHSEAMATASELMDGIGPRLTNTAAYDRAADWAMRKFAQYGLTNVHQEPYPFGLGWELNSYSARMVEPRAIDMRAIPVAWSPATDGVISAPVIVAPMSKSEHLAAWRGKLAGKIVLVTLPGTTSESTTLPFRRFEAKDLADMDRYQLPSDDTTPYDESFVEEVLFPLELSRFLKAEGAVAMVRMSYRDNGLVHGEGYLFEPGNTLALPAMELGAEDYRRLVRLERSGTPPVVQLQIDARYNDADLTADNVIADIAGTDPRAGYVMAGAHFDSWIAADGATDNGTGSVVMLEAARILRQLGVRPKRTIRFALWSGEEQALLGSLAYIEQHLASRPVPAGIGPVEKFGQWPGYFPITPLAGYSDLKAYFNLDNGAGKIRGIYAENNVAAVPTLRTWLAPFASMDAGTVVTRRTGGTDHQYMQSVGIPAFQFIQDPLDYSSRTHHSSVDTLDHARPDDLRQAATIMAAMLWQAANADETLPRPPLPSEPTKSNPFVVEDPDE